jgi:hypothetical protein
MLEVDRTAADKSHIDTWKGIVAPIAGSRSAVSDDPWTLPAARAMFDAFTARRTPGGLSRGDLLGACADLCTADDFEAAFTRFRDLGMLLQFVSKRQEDRYLFNPDSAAGIAIFERVSSEGGVDELLTVLDRTRGDIRRGTATAEQIRQALARARGMLVIAADYLLMLVEKRSIEIMIAERHRHQHPSLFQDVSSLMKLVKKKYPHLDSLAYTVTLEAQRYLEARTSFVERLLDDGARTEDFALLHHEQYLTAALESSVEDLALPLARVVFDPRTVVINPAAIIEAVDQLKRREPEAPQATRPSTSQDIADPVAAMLEREHARARMAAAEAEHLLAGADEVDLTALLAAAGWPRAVMILATLLRAASAAGGYEVVFGDGLRVDPWAEVTYLSPVRLRRATPSPLEATDD